MARIVVDPEPILGILGVRLEHTVDGILAHHRAPCTHAYPYVQSSVAS